MVAPTLGTATSSSSFVWGQTTATTTMSMPCPFVLRLQVSTAQITPTIESESGQKRT